MEEDSGFLFAFKLYVENKDPGIDWIEHMVQRLTHSDIIHVEMIPAIRQTSRGGPEDDQPQRLFFASSTAHTAYVGSGYREHQSRHSLTDSSYMHVFVPVHDEGDMRLALSFLHSLQGKRYNYLALPLTMLPHHCKFRAIQNLHTCFSTSKIFCSQMGLMLCYLCNMLDPEQHIHNQSVFFDPVCCTPADLYSLLMSGNPHAVHCRPEEIVLLTTTSSAPNSSCYLHYI